MTTRIYLGLLILFAVSAISARADDNPAQASARAALVKLLMDSHPPQTPPSPATPSWAVEPPGGYATTAAPAKIAAPQLAPEAAATVIPPDATATVPAPPVAPIPAAPVPTQPQPATAPATPKPATPIIIGKKTSLSAQARPATDIVTIYGTAYKNAQVEKVDWDGIFISYSTAGGGLGMSKVYFKDLPPEYQQQYEKQ